ncbi:uncharacterized protein LOC133013759 [Limanda limanda]|uniref:uncharacterized protein LOC133013759 n=1 Tax=Limanda limanda TaxID=27771 RepID=UPI0029C71B0C|nr:uncharacterized protein LOC133013759 [Limanda limanda]
MPHEEGQPLNLALSPDSVHGQPEIGLPVLSSTPQKNPHLSPGGQKTSSDGQIPCSSVHTSPNSVHTSSSDVPTSSSDVPTSSSGVHTTSSSGLGHSHPLPSSPVMQNQDNSSQSYNTDITSPLPNQRKCNCKCENVAVRLQELENRVNRLVRAQPSAPSTPKTPRGIPSKLTTSAQKYEHVTKSNKSEHLFHKIIDDYRKFRLGSRTGIKDKDNARQAASHALRFCLHMATGLPPKMVSMDMKFLLQIDKLRMWPLYLTEKGYLPTTVRNMMTNVTLFIRHMKCSFQAVSKVRSSDFDKLLYELKMLQMNVHKHVVVHRQKVMKKKTVQLLEATKEVTFMKVAKKKIPELLRKYNSVHIYS